MTGDSASGSTGSEREFGLADAYAVAGPEANRGLYAAWADTYETGFIRESRYVYHRRVAEIFCGEPSLRGEPVLDVGCGTGIVGEELSRLGLRVIDGIDISPEMLDKARRKVGRDAAPVYRQLIEADLTGPVGIASGSYGGIISVGTFTHGHLGPDALGELLRMARPGARCTIGINSAHFAAEGFARRLDGYRESGAVEGLELVPCEVYEEVDVNDPDHTARIAVFTVAAP